MKKLKTFLTFLRSFAKYAGLIAWILSIQYISSNVDGVLMTVFLSVVSVIVILAILLGLDLAEYVVEQKIAKSEAELEKQENGEV